MKEKIKKYWWVIIVLIIVGGAFYWFQWRPSQIRKICYIEQQYYKENLWENQEASDEQLIMLSEQRYEECLRRHGLEKQIYERKN